MNLPLRQLALSIAIASLILPVAAAHPGALVVEGPNGRCYIDDDHGTNVYWKETNGFTNGGVPLGRADVNHKLHMQPTGDAGIDAAYRGAVGQAWWDAWKANAGSGLQKTAGDFNGDGTIDPADTKITEAEFYSTCLSA